MKYAVLEKYQAIHNLNVLCVNQNSLSFHFNNSRSLRKIYCSQNKTIELILNGFSRDKILNDYEILAIMRKEEFFLIPISELRIDNNCVLTRGKDVFVFRVHDDIMIKDHMLQGWYHNSENMKLLNEEFDKYWAKHSRKVGN